jgi:hypothetical protein
MASVRKLTLIRPRVSLTRFFTGVDNVLEITIVTADGNHVIANAYRNKDLFWALRGGGGGTWGVVTSVTYKTHPSTPFSAAFLSVNSTNANSTQNLLTEIIRLTPSLVEQGYGGYGGGSVQGSSSSSYHPTSLQNRPRPLSSRFSNLHIPNQVSPFKTKPSCVQDWLQFYDPCFHTTVRSESRVRFRLGCYPKMSSRPINPKSLLENSSRHLDSGTCEFFFFTIQGNGIGS